MRQEQLRVETGKVLQSNHLAFHLTHCIEATAKCHCYFQLEFKLTVLVYSLLS